MNSENFTTNILVNKDANSVYLYIKNFKQWWSEDIEGNTDQLNEKFFYHYKDVHLCNIQLIENSPNKKLIYLILDNHFNFTNDKTEWTNTLLIFEIQPEGEQTRILFTHQGLTPQYECFEICKESWTNYIEKSLKDYIETGIGHPNPKDKDGLNEKIVEKWKLK
ncbi:MAG: SRPBCC domain-containing protein [Bacteroidetes bacterium]|nr:SRPBCC domain-containing protein [Bacteroidota bacterium]